MSKMTVHEDDLLKWDTSKTSIQLKLGEMVQFFQSIIPMPGNSPEAYIDPAPLMPYLLDTKTYDDIPPSAIEQAKVAIDTYEGMPTVDGIPIWERLEGEPIPYYKMFKQYRDMKYAGVVISMIPQVKCESDTQVTDDSTNQLGSGEAKETEAFKNTKVVFSRSIAKLSEQTQMSGKQLSILSRIYHWQMRVKAYDTYKIAEKEQIKQRNIELLEGKHAKISNELLEEAADYLKKHTEQLSPKVAIDLITLAIKAGRISNGLYGDKPGAPIAVKSASTNTTGSQEGGSADVISVLNQSVDKVWRDSNGQDS